MPLKKRAKRKKIPELEALVKTLPVGVVLSDARCRVKYANPTAANLLAQSESELLQLSLEEALAEVCLRSRQPEQLLAVLQNLKAEENALELEMTLAGQVNELDQKPAEDSFLRLIFFPIGGKNSQWGLLLQDITRYQTADLLKNEFVSVVSHELRTPLSAMQGFSELLLTQENAPAERRRVWLEMINRESVRLTSLLDDLLSLGSIESGKLALTLERIEIEPVIRQCVEILRIGSSKHNFTILTDEKSTAIRADRDKLIQILNNIIGNAIKYSVNGGQINVNISPLPENQGFLCISISDQGIGIPQEEIQHVFEKFYRVPGKYSKEIKGTGLGLAITRKLVELMGGQIWVESQLGKGTTFYFTLPVQSLPTEKLEAFKEQLTKTLLTLYKDPTEAEIYLGYLHRTLDSTQLDEVLRDCLYEIGNRWERDEIGVGDEHFATNIVREFLSRVRPSVTTANGLRMVIGGVAGEEHSIGLTMVANAFGRAGWSVTNLGANVPVNAFITTLEQSRPDILLLSIATSPRLVEIRRVVQAVREVFPDLIIGVGGRLFNELPDIARRLNADFHAATPDETVRLATRAVMSRQERADYGWSVATPELLN